MNQKLALDPENAVGCDHSLIGLHQDETKLSYIMSRPYLGFISYFTASQVADTVIAKIPVSPLYSHSSVSNATDYYTIVNPSLQAYVASCFDYWRGSMSYTFTFSASAFTTARIRITWLPTVKEWENYTTLSASDTITRIVDIKGDTEVSFDIPYLASRLWKRGGSILGSYDALSEPDVDEMTNGILLVTIINPCIVASSAYDSTITYSVRMACASDMQLAKYRGWPPGQSYMPVAGLLAEPDMSWYEQAGLIDSNGSVIDTGILMGENVADIRTILHRYHYGADVTATGSSTGLGGYSYTLSGRIPSVEWQMCPLMMLYLWYRGSTRFKFVWTAGAKPVYVTLRPKKPNDTDTPNTGSMKIHAAAKPNYYAVGQGGSTYICGSLYPECSVEVPYYSDKIAVPTLSATHTANYSSSSYDPDCDIRLDSASTFTVSVFTAFGDDFDMGCLSAAPTVRKTNLDRLVQ